MPDFLDAVLDVAWNDRPPPPARSPLENLRALTDELRDRVKHRWDNVVAIDGEPGVGKSALGLQIAKGVTGGFPKPENVAYSADDVFRLYRVLTRGDVLLYDESVLGLMASAGGRNEEAVRMVQALSIVRVKGISTICCLPDIWILDTFVRYGRAHFWVNVYARGAGKVHRRWKYAKYKRPNRLPYDEAPRYTPLGFRNLDRSAYWREYEAAKVRRVNAWLAAQEFDPTGRTARCPKCGLVGNRYNVATHKCRGESPAPAVAPDPGIGAEAIGRAFNGDDSDLVEATVRAVLAENPDADPERIRREAREEIAEIRAKAARAGRAG